MTDPNTPAADAKDGTMPETMKPEDVPQQLVDAATFAFALRSVGGADGADFVGFVRDMLAAVLPLHERQVRANAAAELRAVIFRCPAHDGRLAFNDGCIGCQRYAALVGAERLVAGRESPSVKAVREMRQAKVTGNASGEGND